MARSRKAWDQPPEQALTLGGVPFCAVDELDEAIDLVMESARRNGGLACRFVNAYSLAISSRDEGYRGLLSGPGVNFPDGKPVATVLSLLMDRGRRVAQVRGPSFFHKGLSASVEYGLSNYFLGATPETLRGLIEEVGLRVPEALVAGAASPPFRPMSDAEIAEQDRRIVESRPGLVWVGLGTPKQDYEAARLSRQYGLTTVAVGAAFDFMAGTKREAPAILRRAGLEWMYRLYSEPRRLWRRYLFGNAEFIRICWRDVRARWGSG